MRNQAQAVDRIMEETWVPDHDLRQLPPAALGLPAGQGRSRTQTRPDFWGMESRLPAPWLWLHVQRVQWAHSPELRFPLWSAECQGAAAALFLFEHLLLEKFKVHPKTNIKDPHVPSPASAVLNSGPGPFHPNHNTVSHLKN